ncbi:hypothetical protein L5515_009507 [Caenorhabditis briggsae]|uniref:Uncharacterized protein n=1 Tax=Caenorhabditis briggsae TaxID=6238 RepID=A0AAE9F901_CAEBR|nr:hypothetical protein L5515_009507 [Caenorhabditis briggsae]
MIGLYLYIWQNLMLLSSCILYIPIGLSIRKFSHLASFQGNQPQRYILWQLVTVVSYIPKHEFDYSDLPTGVDHVHSAKPRGVQIRIRS